MSEFNFKSQICTNRFQSERLLALGLKKETADMVWIPEVDFDAKGEPYDTGKYFERPIQGVWDYTLLEGIPAWSLHRLIEIIFNSLKDTDDEDEIYFIRQKNPYEAILEVFEWLIKEEDFKKEYLEE